MPIAAVAHDQAGALVSELLDPDLIGLCLPNLSALVSRLVATCSRALVSQRPMTGSGASRDDPAARMWRSCRERSIALRTRHQVDGLGLQFQPAGLDA